MKELILIYLRKIGKGETPTEIALALGYNSSSNVAAPLKKLVNDGVVGRECIDGKVLYKFLRNK